MSKNENVWDVYLKGSNRPLAVSGTPKVSDHGDASVVYFADGDKTTALFPLSAVAAVVPEAGTGE